ncbi:leucine-rich repeat-containing G-protein coupled receptor 5 [Parasteatoda tepidariorum]|uniref:leucine-rich repeat-containing G-protein coupled receptor 5 n=1 Tax=Parasteatoda tepidariorum TaxID=114398 RepID=UPI001C720859|nr:leucine-rich repeat-containing G-protein coupled receptor 5 [Parasteatoda tepidariorum]
MKGIKLRSRSFIIYSMSFFILFSFSKFQMSPWSLEKCLFLIQIVLFCSTTGVTIDVTPLPQDPCPRSCVCSGNPDAIRVDCSNVNFTEVPQDIGIMTSILDLSWNNIHDLSNEKFSHLSRLQELNLGNNLLETIPETAFLKLTTLRTLNLQNNKFESIPSASFKPLVNLENLYFSYNHISYVSNQSFAFLPRLIKLELDGNNFMEVPVAAFLLLNKLITLNLASNDIRSIPNYAFQNMNKLTNLYLQNNFIEYVGPNAFDGLNSLKCLEINGNELLELPLAISSLSNLKELTFSNNKIKYLSKSSFQANHQLTSLEFSGNPLESFEKSTFSQLPRLKKLTLSEVKYLEDFPDIMGTTSLQHLRIDRSNLNTVPPEFCTIVPSLRSLNLKSNKLAEIPVLHECKELRLIDLSYNNIIAVEENTFTNQKNLIDLFLSHNLISEILMNSFEGLTNLQVLDLESNEIEKIHPEAFTYFKDLRDLNLGANKFPKLPTKGLQNLRQLKTFNNRELKEFPPVQTFPRINTLALSYAYHCCAFIASSSHTSTSPRPTTTLQETIVWLSKDDVDMASWNSNISDIWPGSGNFSTKFEEFANQLWKTFGRDYTIPDNLAQYAEEYFEDYKSALNNEENLLAKFALQCLPEPGPFMPCEDLFGLWSLRCGIWVVFLLALLGNGIVVIVLIVGRSKMDVPRFLVCNLAMADFFMGVYLGMLAVVDASTLGEFKVSAIKWQTSIGCQVAGFLGVLSTELSVFTLSVITLERNYAITHAMHLNKRLSLRHAGYIMFIGWSFAGAMAALPLFGVSDYRKFAICLPFETEDVWSLTYVVFLILINGVAFLILMGCYLKMYCAIRGSQAWNSNDSRIARRMALLVFTDFICWAPIAFFSLTAVCGIQLISLEEAKVFAIFVLPLNSCANPFLYAIFTKQFKKDCVHICKRIEESRVTRGIGRGRHSSNFSNRHTPITTNSAEAAANAGSNSDPNKGGNYSTETCQCSKTSWSSSKDTSHRGWKEWARKYFLCKQKDVDRNERDGFTYAIAQIQKNLEKRSKHITSITSENFSSRSDSWRQSTNTGTIPMRLFDQDSKQGSWSLQRKASEDSNISYSRQDSSTSTFHMSRSSFSSDSSTQPRASRPLLNSAIMSNRESLRKSRENKPKLCRQGAVSEEKSQTHNRQELVRCLTEKNIDTLCPKCAREQQKDKALNERLACFYNKLADSSYAENETSSSKDDELILSNECSPSEEKTLFDFSLQEVKTFAATQRPHIEVNPMEEKKTDNFVEIEQPENFQYVPKSKLQVDTKEGDTEKCKSLIDISIKLNVEGAKKSSSDNSLKKLSLSGLPVAFKSLPSHEIDYADVSSSSKTRTSTLRSSISEIIVQEPEEENYQTLISQINTFTNKNISESKNSQHWNFLEPAKKDEKDIKISTSSPNITTKCHETAPLLNG